MVVSAIYKKTLRRLGNIKLMASERVAILNKAVQGGPTESVAFEQWSEKEDMIQTLVWGKAFQALGIAGAKTPNGIW